MDDDEDFVDAAAADVVDVDEFCEEDAEDDDEEGVERYVATGLLLEEFIDITDLREQYADAIVTDIG